MPPHVLHLSALVPALDPVPEHEPHALSIFTNTLRLQPLAASKKERRTFRMRFQKNNSHQEKHTGTHLHLHERLPIRPKAAEILTTERLVPKVGKRFVTSHAFEP